MTPELTLSPSLIPGVTIVIPVYGDLPKVEACVRSVIEHAPDPWVDVLIVNDCGPDADLIERRLLEIIEGHHRIRYERNPENLGFVKTCNRAVFELDQTDNDILLLNSDTLLTAGAVSEMREVLALSERHGAVCPRSNDATIATIPVFRREPGIPSMARTAEVFEALHESLPRYYVTPVAIGFCFLARRRIIRNHGLFDEIYGAGYNEENDFCMRINDIGYSSVTANHALVFHASSSSFGAERRAELDAANAIHLFHRYPYYSDMVQRFVKWGFTAIDRFADILVPAAGAQRKVLLDLHHLSKHYDGTTKNVLSMLEHLQVHPPAADIEVVIAAYPDTADFFRLHDYGLRVLDYAHIDEIFDLGISVVPVTSMGQLSMLNRVCARIAVSFLDVIALRTYRHVRQTPLKPVVVQEALRWADRVLAISDGAVADFEALYPNAVTDLHERTRVITQGSGLEVGIDHSSLTQHSRLDQATRNLIEAGGYVLVVGNGFAHKQVVETLLALQNSGQRVLAMADRLIGARFPDVAIALSGTLTDPEIERLYDRAAVVVSPSAYEGFGLSVAEASQRGKPVVVFDTVVAREVVDRLALQNVTFFSTFDRLADTVLAATQTRSTAAPQRGRSLRDYAADFWGEAYDLLERPLDRARLQERDRAVGTLAVVADASMTTAERLLRQNSEILQSTSFRLAQRMARLSGAARKVLRREYRSTVVIDRAMIDQT